MPEALRVTLRSNCTMAAAAQCLLDCFVERRQLLKQSRRLTLTRLFYHLYSNWIQVASHWIGWRRCIQVYTTAFWNIWLTDTNFICHIFPRFYATALSCNTYWKAPELLELVLVGDSSSDSELPVAIIDLVLADIFPAGYTFFYYLSGGGVHPFITVSFHAILTKRYCSRSTLTAFYLFFLEWDAAFIDGKLEYL